METERCAQTGLSDAPVIVEPQRRNTAPAILAAALMLEQTPDAYWSSGIYAGIIHRLGPGAERLAAVQLPTTMTTMPCFGGEGDPKTLFDTSLTSGNSTTDADGGLYCIRKDTAGRARHRFSLSRA